MITEIAGFQIINHIVRKQERHAHISGLKDRSPKLLEPRHGISSVNTREHARGRRPCVDPHSSLLMISIEVGGQATPLQSTGNDRISQLHLQLHRGNLLGRIPQHDHSADFTQFLIVELEGNKGQREGDRTTALNYSSHPADPLARKTDPDHPDRKYCRSAQSDSQPVVSHKFRLPDYRVVCFVM